MTASPAHTKYLQDLHEVYSLCIDTYWTLKTDFISQSWIKDIEFSDEQAERLWYTDVDAQNALQSVASWLSRTYKTYFITMSKAGRIEMIEREFSDEDLRNVKRELTIILREVVMEYSKFNKTILTRDSDMISVVAKMEDWTTEDMGGAFATLAAKYLAMKGDPHYRQWRE